MYKIISFSLWGNKDFYLDGCIQNINLAKEIYPGWDVRFYCDSGVHDYFVDELKNRGAQVVIKQTISSNWEGLFWRFLPASERDVEVFISRDIDSRLNFREKAAVDEWLTSSDKMIHCMRDHLEHNVPILGGMWGCRNGVITNIAEEIANWDKTNYKGCDQDFLKEKIWYPYKSTIFAHDRYPNGISIEQVATNVDEYMLHRESLIDYKKKTEDAKQEYIKNLVDQGLEVIESQIQALFPEVVVPPIKKDSQGRILIDYKYNPVSLFGEHYLKEFPRHRDMQYGTYVGEIIK